MINKRDVSLRRDFLGAAGVVTTSILLPDQVLGSLNKLNKPVKIGVITDLHQDIMHDGPSRLKAFVDSMKVEKPDALMQLGDFAYPSKQNNIVTKAFEEAHSRTFHVLGNHEIDAGHSFDEVAKLWGMKGRYYTERLNGLDLVVLDGNEKPENHKKGYPSYIGDKQLEWLSDKLKSLKGPILIVSHQPLAGPSSIDNAKEGQGLISLYSDKVLMALNGHTHIDYLTKVEAVNYLHVNSASYKWVGGSFRNKSYPENIHSKFPWIEYTCPYRDSLFMTLTIDPKGNRILVKGSDSEWVGKSPSQLGIASKPNLTDGKEICPKIRNRQIESIVH